ncbi:MAG TPA: hypothetical protein PKD53_00240 [Chloroflexaceae bacterium]|nr:hypothetical protein [Chloroflexaceae bacterium]
MIALHEPYAPRPIRPLGLWEEGGWRLKQYGIAYRGDGPRRALVEAARAVARAALPRLAGVGHYGVGFLGIHDGRGANFVFLSVWADENELRHFVFVSPHDAPELLSEVTGSGLIACAWDLALICFERAAWVETVLAAPARPDLDAYLARRLDARV